MKPPTMKRYALHVTTMYPERLEEAAYVYDKDGFEIGYIHLTEQEND